MTGGLGWKIEKKKTDYSSLLHPLSDDEQTFLSFFSDKFSDFSKTYDATNSDLAKKAIIELLPQILAQEGIDSDSEQLEYLSAAAISHLVGFAPLDHMLKDSQIEEIAIIGINKPVMVFVRKKGWQKTDASITSLDYLIHLINKMARPLGRRITYQSARINALMSDGSRLHATIPPLSDGEITIRLHSSKSWSIKDILDSKSTNAQALSFLWLVFQSDSSVLIAGNTACGKTTLLNSLFSFVPLNERIVQIEETPEIKLSHAHYVKLVSSEDIGVPMPELVRDSLRMRPDRVIVGEVRSASEAQAFCETLLSGQARSSYATFHAQSAGEALLRLENLGVPKDNLKSLDFIVIQRRLAHYNPRTLKQTEIRKMTGIYIVEKQSQKTIPIFESDSKTGELASTAHLDFALVFISSRLGISQKEIRDLYSLREKFLSSLKPHESERCLEQIQKFSYGEK